MDAQQKKVVVAVTSKRLLKNALIALFVFAVLYGLGYLPNLDEKVLVMITTGGMAILAAAIKGIQEALK